MDRELARLVEAVGNTSVWVGVEDQVREKELYAKFVMAVKSAGAP